MAGPDRIEIERTAERAALFEALVTSARDAIIAVDDRSHVITFNPAAEAMFGVDATQLLGRSLDPLLPPLAQTSATDQDRHNRHADRPLGDAEVMRAVRANGEDFHVEVRTSHAAIGSQRIRVITLREAAFHQDTTRLTREVDHRAKNILAMVSSLITLTSAPSKTDYIRALAGRVAALTRANALLSLERWKAARLILLVHGELGAHGAGRSVSISGPDMLLSSRSVQPVGMLLHELSRNALRYGALSVAGGTISIDWRKELDGSFILNWREQGGPPALPPGHNGLGLTLIKQIVECQLGGSHKMDWQAGGLVFEGRFPAETLERWPDERGTSPARRPEPIADAEPPAEPTEVRPGSKGSVLIVEDEPILALQLSRALHSSGWSVFGIAGSIEAANRLLSENASPDAAILDVDLGGVPVFPLARKLRHAGIPFLFCTGFEDVAYNREFSECTVVRKPATILQIVSALRNTVTSGNLTSH
jgi:PAS domain S-box-containing protein